MTSFIEEEDILGSPSSVHDHLGSREADYDNEGGSLGDDFRANRPLIESESDARNAPTNQLGELPLLNAGRQPQPSYEELLEARRGPSGGAPRSDAVAPDTRVRTKGGPGWFSRAGSKIASFFSKIFGGRRPTPPRPRVHPERAPGSGILKPSSIGSGAPLTALEQAAVEERSQGVANMNWRIGQHIDSYEGMSEENGVEPSGGKPGEQRHGIQELLKAEAADPDTQAVLSNSDRRWGEWGIGLDKKLRSSMSSAAKLHGALGVNSLGKANGAARAAYLQAANAQQSELVRAQESLPKRAKRVGFAEHADVHHVPTRAHEAREAHEDAQAGEAGSVEPSVDERKRAQAQQAVKQLSRIMYSGGF